MRCLHLLKNKRNTLTLPSQSCSAPHALPLSTYSHEEDPGRQPCGASGHRVQTSEHTKQATSTNKRSSKCTSNWEQGETQLRRGYMRATDGMQICVRSRCLCARWPLAKRDVVLKYINLCKLFPSVFAFHWVMADPTRTIHDSMSKTEPGNPFKAKQTKNRHVRHAQRRPGGRVPQPALLAHATLSAATGGWVVPILGGAYHGTFRKRPYELAQVSSTIGSTGAPFGPGHVRIVNNVSL
jgi:hypothetical protein